MTLEIQHRFADLNGIRMHYATCGEGKLLLFVHGFPEFWYAWKDQLLAFGSEYQAVAPDMRGYNLTSKPTEVEQYGVGYQMDDLRMLAEHLGYRKFILVGHDWGGRVAWTFSLWYPNYLEKLVIINAPFPPIFQRELRDNPDQQKASAYMSVFRTPEAEELLSRNHYAALVDAVLAEGLKQGYFSEADKEAYLEAWSRPGAIAGGLNYYRAGKSGATPPSSIVQVPTLVIWGEKDPYLLPGNLVGLESYVPNLILHRISDATHWVVHEKSALVNGYIREFISS